MSEASFEQALAKAKAYDIESVVRRFMKRRNTSYARAREVADEMLIYLALCSVETNAECTVTGEVDEMWHTFILFTQKYAEFCEIVAGRFLHHVPSEDEYRAAAKEGEEQGKPSPAEANLIGGSYAETLRMYEVHTGRPASPSVWRLPAELKPDEPRQCGGAGCGCKPEPACGCGNPKPNPAGPIGEPEGPANSNLIQRIINRIRLR